MANQFGKVSVGITASTGGLSAGLRDASSKLDKFSRIGSRLRGIQLATTFSAGVTAVQLFARVVGIATRAMTGFVQASSNLVEEQNRSRIVFGDSANAVERFAKGATGIGIAETEALKAAGTFGTLFNNIGMTEDASAKMSMQMTTLSADMASFNNVSSADSLRALRSALVGEVEPIRRLGVVLNDATLRQKAFDMGLTNTVSKTLDPAVKMQAAYVSILEQTTIQQGDATRTISEYAGQQRVLTANLSGLSQKLGQAFQPAFHAIITALNEVMPNLRALIDTFSQIGSSISAGFGQGISMTDIFAGAIRGLAGYVTMLYGAWQVLYAGILQAGRGFSNIAGLIYKFLDGFWSFVGQIIESFEIMSRLLISGLTYPLQQLMKLFARAAELAGADGLAGQLRESARNMETLANRSSGLGEAIQDANKRGGIFSELGDQAFRNAEELGMAAADSFETGLSNITDPLSGFDALLFQEKMGASLAGLIPLVGDMGSVLGETAAATIGASTAALTAASVDSSAGEAFRNSILRGADPRLTGGDTDRQIANNTGRAADGIASLPGRLGEALAGQFATASVTV
jgi:hypothetical protein